MKITLRECKKAVKKVERILREIMMLIYSINPVEFVTPDGVSKIKNDWIKRAAAGFFDNPVFTYNEQLLKKIVGMESAIEKSFRVIAAYEAKSRAAKIIYERTLRSITDALLSIKMARAILNHDDLALKEAVEAKYGVPEESICIYAVAKALELKKGKTGEIEMHITKEFYEQLKTTTFNAEEIRIAFLWVMHEYCKRHPDIKPWVVIITDDASAIDVRDKNSSGEPMIVIPTSRVVTGLELVKLIGHEIEAHWRSSINALSIGALKLDDELIYEGLAKVMDVMWGERIGVDSEPVPYYIIAEKLALSGKSFAETANELDRYLPDDLTGEARAKKLWVYTYRAFRGISDTSNPFGYAFTKDRAYFEGYKYARELIENGQDVYLNFSTLDKEGLKQLMDSIDPASIRQEAVNCEYLAIRALEFMFDSERREEFVKSIA